MVITQNIIWSILYLLNRRILKVINKLQHAADSYLKCSFYMTKSNTEAQCFYDKTIHQEIDAVNQTDYFKATALIYFGKNLLFIIKL